MDAQRFAQRDQRLASTLPRRGAAVLGLAGILAALFPRETASKKRGNSRCQVIRCKPCHRCRRGRCKPVQNESPCGVAGTCLDGVCVDPGVA
jgi:hypothetical protein